jgi:hypothetical protein
VPGHFHAFHGLARHSGSPEMATASLMCRTPLASTCDRTVGAGQDDAEVDNGANHGVITNPPAATKSSQ